MPDMKKAYQIAALAVRQRFAEQHPDYLTVLDAIKSGQVAVYKGSFDQAEAVLRNLNIPIKLDPEPHKLETPIVR